MKEIWKDIKGYEGYYQVSNLGNVRSLDRQVRTRWGTRLSRGLTLKQGLGFNGYYHVTLRKGGIGYTQRIHRLVLETFTNKYYTGYEMVCDHIDGDKKNNYLLNLNWVSTRGNACKDRDRKYDLPLGVTFVDRPYRASYYNNGKKIHLGTYSSKEEAGEAYTKAIKKLHGGKLDNINEEE